MKPILVSGMQPTGRLHIGNYLGALKNFLELQNSGKYQCYFFLADLHALTEGPEPKALAANILNLTADYLAAGLDPKKSVIYQQSQIPAHSELAWVLNTVTPMGDLERMTQYKDKAARQAANVNAGLFTYPVLMAADIVLYDAEFIPVGDDQLQHLELARTVAGWSKDPSTKVGAVVVGAKRQSTPRSKVAARKQVMSWTMPPPTAVSVCPRRTPFESR